MHVLRRPTGTCFFTFCGVQKVWKSTRSVPSRQGYRRKAEKGFKFVCAKLLSLCVLIRGLENLEASLKGFNCCGAKMSLRWADSRFAEPRSFLKKVLIVAVRSYSYSVLIQGLRNLETSCEGIRVEWYTLSRVDKHPKI